MKRPLLIKKILPLALFVAILMPMAVSCNDDPEPTSRTPEDILGIWTDNEGRYMVLDSIYEAFNLYVTEENGEISARWMQDAYIYEPGYNLVVYNDVRLHPEVYQVIELTEESLVWCWVEDLRENLDSGASIGEILGQVIQEAQDGFQVDPDKYQYFTRVSQNDFDRLLEELGIFTPY